ncbi:MAG TPA: DUF4382 domain-containing protein [Flavobacteriaceae bacterium]|nr:DUF4382 domain-containing protein [Flavobacteriaceae bacterium]
MKTLFKFLIAALVVFSQVACNNDDDSTPQKGEAKLMVHLTDAPGDYDAVFVDVQDVMIKYSGEEGEVSLGEIEAGVYDLLELTGGVTVLLADHDVPTGRISQIRLVLGDNNSVVVDGQTHDLQTPSAQQSGLKINVNQDVEANIQYEFILDFNVEESIVVQGNGNYLLKPVIRASLLNETGSISGSLFPIGITALVTASNNTDTISAYTNADGEFYLHGVPEGTYTITIEPDISFGFAITSIIDVVVLQGQITTLGEIELDLL